MITSCVPLPCVHRRACRFWKSASIHFLLRAKLVTTSSSYYVEYRMLLTIPVEEPVSSWLFKHTFGVEIHYCTIEMVNAAFWVLWIGSHQMLSIKLPSENISLAHMPLITYFCFLHRGRKRRWENWDSNRDLSMINSHSCCVSKPYLLPSTVFCDTQRGKRDDPRKMWCLLSYESHWWSEWVMREHWWHWCFMSSVIFAAYLWFPQLAK